MSVMIGKRLRFEGLDQKQMEAVRAALEQLNPFVAPNGKDEWVIIPDSVSGLDSPFTCFWVSPSFAPFTVEVRSQGWYSVVAYRRSDTSECRQLKHGRLFLEDAERTTVEKALGLRTTVEPVRFELDGFQ